MSEAQLPTELLTGYVLAGGASSRMGQDKALLNVNGHTLVEIAVTKLRKVCADVAVLSGFEPNEQRATVLRRFARLVPDRQPQAGPVAGISSALRDATTPWIMVVAVDQPFLPVSLLRRWFEAAETSNCVASCIQPGDRLEPVPLLLRSHLRDAVEQCLHRGDRKVLTMIEATLQQTASPPLHRFSVPSELEEIGWFRNLNRPEDLASIDVKSTSSNQNTVCASD